MAKSVLELVTSIPREGLRSGRGGGLLGTPLITENSQEKETMQDQGDRCESSIPEKDGGASDV